MWHVAFFVYPGFVLLDLSGPLEAFATAESMAPGSYRLSIVSLEGGEIASSTGLAVMTGKASMEPVDTLVVVGDFSLPGRNIPREYLDFLRFSASSARRTASVCMGAFLLAASGVLDDRRATTHWRYAAKLQAAYPKIHVDGDRIFIADNGIWTSAGMTAGIDMVLVLIEDDLGRDLSRAVARMLVVFYRRPGGQHQFSSLLDLDPESDRIRIALAFAREHLADPLPVERLAEVSRLSVRQFGRTFLAATGMTPAKAVERLRVEAARSRIEDGRETFDVVARAVGFADPQRMCQGFLRVLGCTPQSLRRVARSKETPIP